VSYLKRLLFGADGALRRRVAESGAERIQRRAVDEPRLPVTDAAQLAAGEPGPHGPVGAMQEVACLGERNAV